VACREHAVDPILTDLLSRVIHCLQRHFALDDGSVRQPASIKRQLEQRPLAQNAESNRSRLAHLARNDAAARKEIDAFPQHGADHPGVSKRVPAGE
jgi:hypothetical protein